MRAILLLVFLADCWPMAAQFSGLSTTTDGSQLYFSSTLRLRGSAEQDAPKIFQHGTNFELFREVIRDNSGRGFGESNYYMLIEPEVSADGKVVVYTSTPECYGTPTDNCLSPYLANISAAGSAKNIVPAGNPLTGYGRLSADGRYVATCCLPSAAFPQYAIVDLNTGQTFPGFPLVGDAFQAFADGGMLLTAGQTYSSVTIVHAAAGWVSGTSIAMSTEQVVQAQLSRDGSTILYEGLNSGGTSFELVTHNIASGAETLLDTVPVANPFDLSYNFSSWISDNGKLALYLRPLQPNGPLEVFAENTDGTARRIVANLMEGFNAITLSGDGATAYAATPSARLLRIDVGTGATSQLNGPVPLIADLQPCAQDVSCVLGGDAVAPGSVAWLDGSAFPATGEPVAVLVNGIKAPIFLGTDSYVRLQIPWETPVNQRISLVVENSEPQPFESAKTANSASIVPNMVLAVYPQGSAESGFLALYHQNFSSLVSDLQPAADGEILHLYMLGLGPVSPAVPTGERAPAGGSLSRIVNPMTCVAGGSQNVPIEFAGLAPGLTGIYQVDLKAPAGFSNDGQLICTITDSAGNVYQAQGSLP